MIIIAGPSGAGKSSQAGLLIASRPNYVHIEIGKELRKAKDPAIQADLLTGRLISDTTAGDVIQQAVGQVAGDKEVVLDGFPRRLSQLPILEKILSSCGRELELMIVLDVDYQTVLNRLAKRGRSDDEAETIATKWQLFNEQTKLVVQHFEELGKVVHVDGSLSPEEVHKQILRILPR